jgi:glycosyltransferase involved in cell wall biosynthesis
MRILIVSQYFWPEDFRINDLVSGLKEKGHNLTVLTGIPNYPDGRIFSGYGYFKKRKDNFNDIPVLRAPLIPRGRGGGLRLALNFLSFALSAIILSPFYCRGKFDIIFAFEPSPITVALPAIVLKGIKSAPFMFWMQDLWPESLSATGAIRSKTILRMVELMVRCIYKGCDKILIQSRAFSSSIIKQGGDPADILYYPNSAEDFYNPVELNPDAAEREFMPEGFCVTFAGNIGAAQDFNTILNAAVYLKNNKDIHWIIIGDGRLHSWVKEQIDKRGLKKSVHLLGRHPAVQMPRFFSLTDVLLVTLRKDPIFALTIPSKVQSYLACAKPVIAALDGEGAKVIEEAHAGLACPAENPEALAETVLRFYRMPKAERKSMGLNGRAYFEKHFERKMLLDQLENWMMELQSELR